MPIRVAINGFGRIGRNFFRQALQNPEVELVAINDLGNLDNLAYLLKYDTVYGRTNYAVEAKGAQLVADDRKIEFYQQKDPALLPWAKLQIDVVVESTGVFDSKDKASAHLVAGAKRVVISAPAKDEATPTSTPNVGLEHLQQDKVTSNASCTTNATTPVVAILGANPGILKGMLSTAHGYTATQSLVDGPMAKDFRRGRAAAQNIVPSSTGAAEAVERAIPAMKGKFDGIALRVPVVAGSIIDFVFLAARPTSADEINQILRKAAKKPEWQGIFAVSEEPLVSSDIIGQPYGSIADLSLTRVVDGNLVKVMSWYDNEYGYCAMLLKHVLMLKELL